MVVKLIRKTSSCIKPIQNEILSNTREYFVLTLHQSLRITSKELTGSCQSSDPWQTVVIEKCSKFVTEKRPRSEVEIQYKV